MPIGDSLNPKDDILFRLMQGPQPEDLAFVRLCPSGHPSYKHIIEVMRDWDHQGSKATDGMIKFVVYLCHGCIVAYKYHETTLPNGSEGAPE